MWAICTAIYIAELIMCVFPDYQLNNLTFLGPSERLINEWQGMNCWEIQQNYQIWRFITPLFLTNGFSQYVNNSIFLLLIGFIFEGCRMPFFKTLMFYLIVGFGGELFGAVCNTNSYLWTGSQPASCGLLGGMLGLLILNWKALSRAGNIRIMLAIFPFIIFISVLLYTMNSWSPIPGNLFAATSPTAMFGGFLTGVPLGLIMLPAVRPIARQPTSIEKKLRKIGALILLILWAVFLVCFFLADDYLNTAILLG